MKVKKGTLVYIPANVRLVRPADETGDFQVKDYVVTKKPVNCLVVGDPAYRGRQYKIIYEGTVWYVNSNNVYEIEKESTNASEAS
tara:strand:+ start:522 stop:776 length:255 start_codon:yes stop_codon:yes gene_type:complete